MLEEYSYKQFVSYEEFYRDFSIKVPERFNFSFDVMDVIAQREPNKTAIVWCDENGNEKIITFGELARETNKTACFLKRIGIEKQDPVMLVLKRDYRFWYCLLALHKLGAIAIPATHLLKTRDYVYRNNAADTKAIIAVGDAAAIQSVNEAEKDSPSLKIKISVSGGFPGWMEYEKEVEKEKESFSRSDNEYDIDNGDISLLYFTSGTTGYPKMVMHNYTYPLGHVLTAGFWQRVKKGGLHFTVADTGWAKAVWGKIYGQWLMGSAVFVYDFEKFNPSEMLKTMEKYKITTFCAPPTVYRFLIKEDLARFDLGSLEYCVIAGEPLNPEVYNQFHKATGIKLMEGYGQTECTVAIATYPWIEPRPGSMGKPSPGYHIDILNDQGESCEVGEEGQIVIKTEKGTPVGMFDGYYRDRERTENVWNNGIYYTGDMAWKDEDGYFWFVGRADDVIKSSGYRIGPFEVESALLEHPAVLETAITAVPDPDRGQVVKATVVLAKGYASSSELVTELQDHVKRTTAPYKYPRIVEFVEELPKTISGKIRRVEIRGEKTKGMEKDK